MMMVVMNCCHNLHAVVVLPVTQSSGRKHKRIVKLLEDLLVSKHGSLLHPYSQCVSLDCTVCEHGSRTAT